MVREDVAMEMDLEEGSPVLSPSILIPSVLRTQEWAPSDPRMNFACTTSALSSSRSRCSSVTFPKIPRKAHGWTDSYPAYLYREGIWVLQIFCVLQHLYSRRYRRALHLGTPLCHGLLKDLLDAPLMKRDLWAQGLVSNSDKRTDSLLA